MRLGRRSRGEPVVSVAARVVQGPPVPRETRVTGPLRDLRFWPETPHVVFDRVTAERVDFSGLQLWAFLADNCRFVDCDFSGISVEGLPFASGGSEFERCRFERSQIGDFGNVRLVGCEFIDAELSGWFTWHADIVECRFSGPLRTVVFEGSSHDGRSRNDFRGNDFRDADLDDVAFRGGIDLDAQSLPTGNEYVRLRDVKTRVKRARRELRRLPDMTMREEALAMLDLFARVFTHEPDVFTKRSFILEMADDESVGLAVLEALELA